MVQIKLGFIGSSLAVILSLNIFLSNNNSDANNLIDILISTSFLVAIILFIYSNYRFIISRIFPKIARKPIIKNISYSEVLKINTDDRRTYLSNILSNGLNINFIIQILFAISMIAPIILPSVRISVWDKSVLWIAYFLLYDILSILIFPLINKNTTYSDFLFDSDFVSNLQNELLNIKKWKLISIFFILIFGLFLILSYLYVWIILTIQYILFNLDYLLIMIGEAPFIYLIIFIITSYFIHSINEFISHKYKYKILVLKQEKYREIRRKLYETNSPYIEDLWFDFTLNAPW